jgi:hypothetical protein
VGGLAADGLGESVDGRGTVPVKGGARRHDGYIVALAGSRSRWGWPQDLLEDETVKKEIKYTTKDIRGRYRKEAQVWIRWRGGAIFAR